MVGVLSPLLMFIALSAFLSSLALTNKALSVTKGITLVGRETVRKQSWAWSSTPTSPVKGKLAGGSGAPRH